MDLLQLKLHHLGWARFDITSMHKLPLVVLQKILLPLQLVLKTFLSALQPYFVEILISISVPNPFVILKVLLHIIKDEGSLWKRGDFIPSVPHNPHLTNKIPKALVHGRKFLVKLRFNFPEAFRDDVVVVSIIEGLL